MQFNELPISWLELFGSDRWIREVHKRLEDLCRLFLVWLYMATTDQVIYNHFNLTLKFFTLFLSLWQTSLICNTAKLDVSCQLLFSKAFSHSLQDGKNTWIKIHLSKNYLLLTTSASQKYISIYAWTRMIRCQAHVFIYAILLLLKTCTLPDSRCLPLLLTWNIN